MSKVGSQIDQYNHIQIHNFWTVKGQFHAWLHSNSKISKLHRKIDENQSRQRAF